MTAQEAIDVLFNEWKCIDRNDGIHCDRKCETCDLVMGVGIIREAFNMAISVLEAQELSNNSTKLDSGNGECKWCKNIEDRHLRIEYYWIDDEGNTASFSQPHHIATGIANYCPNCGRKLKDQEESDGNSKD